LQGDRTGLGDPHGIALDTRNDLIFVSNFGSTNTMRRDVAGGAGEYGREGVGKEHWPLDRDHAVPGSGRNMPPSITVYSKKASGDTAPLRVIRGPRTQLNWPAGMTVDSDRGELFVANDMGDSVLVFSTSANGDAAPIRVLKGPKTLIRYPNGVTLDLVNNELWVANFGNHTATVYRRDASGDTPPLRVIRSGPLNANVPTLGNPFPVAFDTKRGEILVPN
jgi:DNA-binding beta-propeller fold protein YncE